MAADSKSCCGGEAAMNDTGISREKVRKAKNSFTAILDDLNDLERNVFYNWIEEQRRPERNNKTKSDRPCCSEERLKQEKCCNKTICKSERLADIALDLRKLVPLEGTLKTEKILKHDLPPGCHYDDDDDDPSMKKTLHIDAFIYDDDEIDCLEDEGKLSRSFCQDCGSNSIEQYDLISHSMSPEQMDFLFCDALPQITKDVKTRKLLDVGSRFGAVLYGAHEKTDMEHIIGVEMNKELCDIQRKIIKDYSMEERVLIIHADINNCPNVVKSADIIILHNVFEYFLPQEDKMKAWRFLRKTISKDTILITVPSVEESLITDNMHDLVDELDTRNWLRPITISYDEAEATDEFAPMETMYFYQVVK